MLILGLVWLTPCQRGDVSEYLQQLLLLAEQARISRADGFLHRLQPPAQLTHSALIEVVAEQVTAEGRETAVVVQAGPVRRGGQD